MYTSVHSILKPPHTSLPTLSLQILTTPVFLPGESHGVRSLVGYSPEGHKELNMIEATEHTHRIQLHQILLQGTHLAFGSLH